MNLNIKFRTLWLVTTILLSLTLSACSTTTSGGAVGADRSQLLLVSSEKVDQMAVESYSKLKQDSTQKGVLNTDPQMLSRIRGIAYRLQSQTGVFRSDAPAWNWEVNIIQSDELNAFCMPGGKIMFYSGIISKLNLTDAEIANIMGHEMAHALREHSREQISQAIAAQGAIGLGASLLGLGDGSTKIAGAVYQSLVATKFSRTDESEADQIGLELAARAGFDPRAGVTLWQKMTSANSNGAPPEILSSHPAGNNRIKQIEALLPTVMPFYEGAR